MMQWFAMSGDLGGIAVLNCPPHMTAAFYRDYVLEGTLVPQMAERIGADTPFKFVQDNASIHTAGIVENWFDRQEHIEKLPWAPFSPDLNPIENLFGLIALEWDPRFEMTPQALEAHAIEVYQVEVYQAIQRRPQMFTALSSSTPRRIQHPASH
ncbi:hypothetical protein FOCC_FOCC013210 [Frankliniella occidentalis]|nr:hypothetical protein FOCC_FOCC013210 [Frankliniella occidentalis]